MREGHLLAPLIERAARAAAADLVVKKLWTSRYALRAASFHQADDREQDLQVLAGCMQHLQGHGRPGVDDGRRPWRWLRSRLVRWRSSGPGAEQRGQRTELRECERVDADRPAWRGQLQQAELGAIRALAQELGIDAERLAGAHLAGDGGEK
jgi:hypothetical protein